MGIRQQWAEWGLCKENHPHHHHQPGSPAPPDHPGAAGERQGGGRGHPVGKRESLMTQFPSPHRHSWPKPFSTTSRPPCAGLWSLWQRELALTVSNISSECGLRGLGMEMLRVPVSFSYHFFPFNSLIPCYQTEESQLQGIQEEGPRVEVGRPKLLFL